MKTIEVNLYQYSELPEEAKEKALDKLWDINVNFPWWDCVYDDAGQVGVDITAFSIDCANYVNSTINYCYSSAELIVSNHGEKCDSWILAKKYLSDCKELEKKYSGNEDSDDYQDKLTELNDSFENDINEIYLQMLKDEYESQTKKEQIIETIEVNDYDFTIDGELYSA